MHSTLSSLHRDQIAFIVAKKNEKKQNNTVKQGRPNILDKNVPVTRSWPSQVENIQAPSVALKERSGGQITWENGILSSTPGAHWPRCTAWKADRGKHDSLPCSSSARCKVQRMNARCTKRPTVRTQKNRVFFLYILYSFFRTESGDQLKCIINPFTRFFF